MLRNLQVLWIFVSIVFANAFRLRKTALSKNTTLTRIYHGQTTAASKHPYFATVELDGVHLCGGTVIRPTVVITSVYCLESGDLRMPFRYQVRIAPSDKQSGGVTLAVSTIITHPWYNYRTQDYDAALVVLKKSEKFGIRFRPIRMPTETQYLDNSAKGFILGFGETEDSNPWLLRKKELIVWPQANCSKAFKFVHTLTPRQFCAGIVGPCAGDAGGPFIYKGKLYGIISVRRGSCISSLPTVFTSIPAIRSWIRQQISV